MRSVGQAERDDGRPGGHGHVLLSIEACRSSATRSRTGWSETARAVAPLVGVDRHEGAAVFAEEHDAAGGAERAAPRVARAGLRAPPTRCGRSGRRSPAGSAAAAVCSTASRNEPPMKPLPASQVGRRPRQDAAPLVGLHVVEAGGRVERRRVPVGRAVDVRADAPAFERGVLIRRDDRPPFGRQAGGPRQVAHERGCPTGSARWCDRARRRTRCGCAWTSSLRGCPSPHRVDQRRRLLRVEVPDVVRRVLEVPLQRAASWRRARRSSSCRGCRRRGRRR